MDFRNELAEPDESNNVASVGFIVTGGTPTRSATPRVSATVTRTATSGPTRTRTLATGTPTPTPDASSITIISNPSARGDADCSLLLSAADVVAEIHGLTGHSACGNDDCDRDGGADPADLLCTAGCLFGACPVPSHAPRVTSVLADGTPHIAPYSLVRVTGANFGSNDGFTHVTIDGLDAPVLQVVDSSTLIVLVPSVTLGAVEIVVHRSDLAGAPHPMTVVALPTAMPGAFEAMLDLFDSAAVRFTALDLASVYGVRADLVRESIANFRTDLAVRRAALAADPSVTADVRAQLDAAIEVSGLPERLRLLSAEIDAPDGATEAAAYVRDGGGRATALTDKAAELGAWAKWTGAWIAFWGVRFGAPPAVALGAATSVLGGIVETLSSEAPVIRSATFFDAHGALADHATAAGGVDILADGVDASAAALLVRASVTGLEFSVSGSRGPFSTIRFTFPNHETFCGPLEARVVNRTNGGVSARTEWRVQPRDFFLAEEEEFPLSEIAILANGAGRCNKHLTFYRDAGRVRQISGGRPGGGPLDPILFPVPYIAPGLYTVEFDVNGLKSPEAATLRVKNIVEDITVHCEFTTLLLPPASPSSMTCTAVPVFVGVDTLREFPYPTSIEWSPSTEAVSIDPIASTRARIKAEQPGEARVTAEASAFAEIYSRSHEDTAPLIKVVDKTAPKLAPSLSCSDCGFFLESLAPGTVLRAGDHVQLRARAWDNVAVELLRVTAVGDAIAAPATRVTSCDAGNQQCELQVVFSIKPAGTFSQPEVRFFAEAFDEAGQSSQSAVIILPVDVQPAPAPVVYIADDEQIVVIDSETNAVTGTIPVGSFMRQLAANRDGSRLYTINDDRTLAVIDPGARMVLDRVLVCDDDPFASDYPFGLALAPDDAFAYVGCSSTRGVKVIDTQTNTVVDHLGADIPGSLGEIATRPNSNEVWGCCTLGNEILVIRTDTNEVGQRIYTGGYAEIAFLPSGDVAYLKHRSTGLVTEVNAITHEVAGTIRVSSGDYGGDLAVTPDGRFLYTANASAQPPEAVTVVDTASRAVVAHVPLGGQLGGGNLAITPDGKFVYVIGVLPGFAFIDTSTNTATVSDVRVGDPRAIVIRPGPPADE